MGQTPIERYVLHACRIDDKLIVDGRNQYRTLYWDLEEIPVNLDAKDNNICGFCLQKLNADNSRPIDELHYNMIQYPGIYDNDYVDRGEGALPTGLIAQPVENVTFYMEKKNSSGGSEITVLDKEKKVRKAGTKKPKAKRL